MTTNDVQYLRSGLRVRCEKDVNPSVRRTLFKLCGLVTYIYGISYKGCCISKTDSQLKTRDTRELASATFFAPYDKTVEPYIRIATGDYEELVSERKKIYGQFYAARLMR
ncbi:hypothetical protein N0U24_01750 [Peribacillus frigoritolerans]|uniref:hypothetical protein n=1 Tax=Peribacillus frigoritolerans TaxID=450367 RepID=UPI0021A9C219|nr:hypothetical protein [Peribacillus frigoritolerans]MCT4475883.1 hypothetical protein [Peribacillus frigoritolerans]